MVDKYVPVQVVKNIVKHGLTKPIYEQSIKVILTEIETVFNNSTVHVYHGCFPRNLLFPRHFFFKSRPTFFFFNCDFKYYDYISRTREITRRKDSA